MNRFRVTFKYSDNGEVKTKDIDIGYIQSISSSYAPSVTTTGIPSQPAQNTFVMDTGVTRTMTFSFRRITPRNPTDSLSADSTNWSNGFWMYIIKKYLVNRWQAETDGCRIRYESDDENLYPSMGMTNAYISRFTPEQDVGDIYTVHGNLGFTIGATNLAKVVANHTVIYDANFSQFQGGSDDETNYVYVTNYDSVSAITPPANWLERAVSQYGQAQDVSIEWNTEADGTGTTYTAGQLIELTSEVTTIYARYV